LIEASPVHSRPHRTHEITQVHYGIAVPSEHVLGERATASVVRFTSKRQLFDWHDSLGVTHDVNSNMHENRLLDLAHRRHHEDANRTQSALRAEKTQIECAIALR